MTELEQRIVEMASTDFPAFVKLVGEPAIVRAKVCLLIKEGKTQEQVARKVHISRIRVQRMRCNSC